jgi:hypothetical protein
MSYVERVEMKYNDTAAEIHCQGGDSYWAGKDGDSWWLAFMIGQPSEGPFADVDAVVTWLNEDQ